MKLPNVVRTLGMGALVVSASVLAPVMVDKVAQQAGYEVSLGGLAQAQQKEVRQPRKLPGLSLSFTEDLGEVEELLAPPEDSGEEPNPREAKERLERMLRRCEDECNKYELANIYNFMAWVSYELDDYASATDYYKKVLEQSPQIPWGLEEQTLLTVARFESSEENFRESLKYIDRYFDIAVDPNADVYYLKSVVCYQMEDFNCSLENINTAISMEEAKGNIAKEPWYDIQRGIHVQRENWSAALPIQKKMVRHYPSASHWTLLGQLYSALEEMDKQLYVLDTAFIAGNLTKEGEYIQLAQLLNNRDVPYRAAKVMVDGIRDKIVENNGENLERTGRFFYFAQEIEESIEYMSAAAEKSDKGDLWAEVVGLQLMAENLPGAVDAGRAALKKEGGLEKPGRLHFQMGQAYFEMKQYDNAIASFEKAKEDKDTRRVANQWLEFTKNEKNRYERLKEFLES